MVETKCLMVHTLGVDTFAVKLPFRDPTDSGRGVERLASMDYGIRVYRVETLVSSQGGSCALSGLYLGFRFYGLGFRVSCLGLRVWGLRV